MVHRVDESRETQCVRQKDELLANWRADLSDLGEEFDGGPARLVDVSPTTAGQRVELRAHIHSSVVKLTSRAKSCRWVTSFSKTNFCLCRAQRGWSVGAHRRAEARTSAPRVLAERVDRVDVLRDTLGRHVRQVGQPALHGRGRRDERAVK